MFKEIDHGNGQLVRDARITGEDGFEISVPVPGTLKLVEDLVADENVHERFGCQRFLAIGSWFVLVR